MRDWTGEREETSNDAVDSDSHFSGQNLGKGKVCVVEKKRNGWKFFRFPKSRKAERTCLGTT